MDCAHCRGETLVRVTEGLLEALCHGCGNNLALGRARALLQTEGAEALMVALTELGLRVELGLRAELSQGGDPLEHLIASGQLRRDLRLTLELDPDAGTHRYGAAPLASLALPEEVEAALEERRARGGALADAVAARVLARLAATVRAVGAQSGLPTLSSADLPPPADVVDLVPQRARLELGALPLARGPKHLLVAVSDPLDATLREDLESLSGLAVHFVLATPEQLAGEQPPRPGSATAASRFPAAHLLDGLDDLEELDGLDGRAREADALALASLSSSDLGPDPLEAVLLEALEEGAESLRVEPREGAVGLRLSVRGELRAPRLISRELADALLERLATGSADGPGALQRARSRWEVSGLPVELEARWLETPFGPSLHVTLSQDTPRPLPLGHLGLGFQPLAAFEAGLIRGGLILIGAPREDERSAAYLGALARIARQGGEVISLERRVRHFVPGAAQLETAELGEPPRALGAPPPDWLGIDGALDPATLRLALDVVLAGGGALIAVPARDAETALLRLEAEGAPRALLERLLTCVLARRVVRGICPHCRFLRQPGSWVGLGCPACDDGSQGDLAVAELLSPGPDGQLEPAAGSPRLRERAAALVGEGRAERQALADLLPAPLADLLPAPLADLLGEASGPAASRSS